jgi:molybdate transport system substrate-binding protein
MGLWPAVESKSVPCESVRAVLAAVESGNVDAGIIYRTDAAISRRTSVAFEVPPSKGPRIVYPAGLVKDSRNADAARRFLKFLSGPESAAVFRKFGFMTAEPRAHPAPH